MTDALRYQTPFHWTAAYLMAAALLLGLSFVREDSSKESH
jgi:hypothetical protein